MRDLPKRRTSLLRKGRISLVGARYFVTCNCIRPASRLIDTAVAENIIRIWARMESDNDGIVQSATVMPDHVHMLILLSGRLTIGQMMGKLKSLSKSVLANHGIEWQENFFEHRLRPDEQANQYALYIFLNPYREKLIERRAVWPYWRRHPDVDCDFLQMLEEGLYPRAEWLTSSVEELGISPRLLGDHEGP